MTREAHQRAAEHDLVEASPSPSRTVVSDVSHKGDEILIRVRLDGAGFATPVLPAVITTRNCSLVGLTARQFRALVSSGVIRGRRLPHSKAVAATLDAVLAAVRGTNSPPYTTTPNADEHVAVSADSVLDAAGVPRPRG